MPVSTIGYPDAPSDTTKANHYWRGSAYKLDNPEPEVLSAGAHTHTLSIKTAGDGVSHNNLQPYQVIYRWKRTA